MSTIYSEYVFTGTLSIRNRIYDINKEIFINTGIAVHLD